MKSGECTSCGAFTTGVTNCYSCGVTRDQPGVIRSLQAQLTTTRAALREARDTMRDVRSEFTPTFAAMRMGVGQINVEWCVSELTASISKADALLKGGEG
jgi:hypothetical protein